jgi:hypothetical protein
MTYHGTNTYLIQADEGYIVLDPGPDDEGHLDDIRRGDSAFGSARSLSALTLRST